MRARHACPGTFACLVVASLLPAQVPPGHSLAGGAIDSGATRGGVWLIDHSTRSATRMTTSATLDADVVNSMLLLTGGFGVAGTNPSGANADIYQIVISGTTITETKINTTSTAGGNLAQIALVGSDLYFTTQGGIGGGVLQSVPLGGGAVNQVVDLGTVSGVFGLANAVTAVGSKVYVGTFDSGSTNPPGEIVEYDVTTQQTVKLMDLPKSKLGSGTTNFGIVKLREHPLRPGNLVALGVYGDVLEFDSTGATVAHHWTGTSSSNRLNSFDWDPVREMWVVGSRTTAIEYIVAGHSAEDAIPVATTGNGISFASIDHIPGMGSDVVTGPGCPGNGGYTLTAVSRGDPVKGNAGFAMDCYSGTGGDLAILAVGTTDPGFDLASLGAPGCIQHTDGSVLTRFLLLQGSGHGAGHASVSTPIPATLGTSTFTWQFAQLQSTPTNALGLVVSNGQQISIP